MVGGVVWWSLWIGEGSYLENAQKIPQSGPPAVMGFWEMADPLLSVASLSQAWWCRDKAVRWRGFPKWEY